MTTCNFSWTLSKVMAFAILILGTIASMILKDSQLGIISILTSAGLMGFKTGTTAYIESKTKHEKV